MGHQLNPTAVACDECGHLRVLRYPTAAGRMCRPCAAKVGTKAAARANAKDPLERLERLTDRTAGRRQCWENMRRAAPFRRAVSR